MGKEGEKGGMLCRGKSAPSREEASTSHQGKGTGRRKEAEESRGRRSGMPCKGKSSMPCKERSAARMEEEFVGGTEKKS